MASSPRIIVSVTNDLYTDQRVHKVCSFLHESGWDVMLVGRRKSSSVELPPRTYATKRFRLFFEKGPLFYAFFNLRLFFFLLFKRSDVFLSNDLDTLLANYCVSRLKKIDLVYDTHELFTEVPELVTRPRVQKMWLAIEKWIFPKLNRIYTVNKSIARIYSEKYGVEVKVVRNVSPKWESSKTFTRTELGLPENKRLIIIQGAGINIDRGAEEAVAAMQLIPSVLNCVLIIVGDGDVVPHLKGFVQLQQLEDRVLFYGRQPYERMMQYTKYADIGLTLDKDTNPNYRFSLPNKVFDYIHAETPIIATDLVEVKNIIEEHRVGEVLTPFTANSLALRIQFMLEHPERLEAYKINCAAAAILINWQNETDVLKEIYTPLWTKYTTKKGGTAPSD